MNLIYTYNYRVTSKCDISGRVSTFESIFKNEKEIKRSLKQTDHTLVKAEILGQAACIGSR